MSDSGQVVTDFVKLFDSPPTAEQIAPFFTEDAVYLNVPMQPIIGRDAIAAVLGGMGSGMRAAGWEVIHQVVQGNVVMNERVDRFTVGDRTIAVPVMGVFVLRDGKIAEWRDYFDMNMWQSQMPKPAS
jgi:limonene-1,2-epoxide hydrolase